MSIQNKPDYKIFASDAKSGEIETFPDILRGWGVTIDRTGEIPPMEWFNAIGKRTDEWLLYLTQRGIPEWDSSLDYPKSAVVTHGDVIYVSLRESKGESPDTSSAAWSTLSAFLGLGSYALKGEDYPVGAPIPWPQSAPPSGFLACNGQSFNKTTYPLLALAYPSGFLPDLRGEFIRGWDDGRGVDSGRVLLSSQGFAMEPTIGSATGFGALSANDSSGALGFSPSTATQEKFGGTSDNKKFYDLYLDNRGTAQTANETRPRNIAFNYIVRAA